MIKLHPPHQEFSANAYRSDLPQLAELYQECNVRRVPIMFHTGTSIFPRARNVYADPMPIDDVAVDFPNIPIILAHAGRPLYGETAFFWRGDIPTSGSTSRAFLRSSCRATCRGSPEIADKILWERIGRPPV
jgi:predicted TIM-barrel fold metal-dependent hydrolase